MKFLKNCFNWVASKVSSFSTKVGTSLAVTGSVLVGELMPLEQAQAALPTAAATAFSTIQTDILSLVDLAWPLMIAVTIAFIIMRLFKKSAHAAV